MAGLTKNSTSVQRLIDENDDKQQEHRPNAVTTVSLYYLGKSWHLGMSVNSVLDYTSSAYSVALNACDHKISKQKTKKKMDQ